MSTKIDPSGVMYVAAGSMGFTYDPNQAKKDIWGIPILGGGALLRVTREERKKGQNVLDMLHEALLDSIEQMWDIQEKPAEDFAGGEAAKVAAVNLAKGHASGIARAIAAHKYTAEYLNPETREAAIERVKREALAAFEEDE